VLRIKPFIIINQTLIYFCRFKDRKAISHRKFCSRISRKYAGKRLKMMKLSLKEPIQ